VIRICKADWGLELRVWIGNGGLGPGIRVKDWNWGLGLDIRIRDCNEGLVAKLFKVFKRKSVSMLNC